MPWAPANGRDLHYAEQGEGPLAVLIHGYPLDHTLWLDQLAALSDIRRVVALDLRGYGLSSPVTGDPLTMEGFAADVAALIPQLGHDQADIVGLSMGGYVALALWENHPGVIRSLVLANTRSGADSDAGRAGREAQAQSVVSDGREQLAAKLLTALLGPDHDLSAAARLRTMVEGTRVETIVGSLRGMAARPDRTGLLAGIDVPTLVISSEADELIPPPVSEEMADLIPAAGFVVIPGSGHLPPIERPEEFSQALRQFWE
jgi:pimeloyl-ACP methyl ester carboxylesterase